MLLDKPSFLLQPSDLNFNYVPWIHIGGIHGWRRTVVGIDLTISEKLVGGRIKVTTRGDVFVFRPRKDFLRKKSGPIYSEPSLPSIDTIDSV